MYAIKHILETDYKGNLKKIPDLPANKIYEVIFLVVDDEGGNLQVSRKPHADIVGQMEIHGDIFNSVSVKQWDLPE
jgi:hypothetical protein